MALTIIAITMAIALVTAGSLNASVLAQRKSRGGSTTTLGGTATSSSSSTGASPRALMSEFVKCLRSAGTSTSSLGTTSGSSSSRGAAMLTRADVTNCYDSVYRGAGSSLGGAGGSSLGGAGSGGTSPSG